jgi:hypothetical protein
MLTSYPSLVLLLPPECVSPALAVEMWGWEQVGPTSQMRVGFWIVVEIRSFGVEFLERGADP